MALAVTGALYLIPGIIGLYNQKYYGGISTTFIGLTSIAHHSTHNRIIELIDKAAIINFTIAGYMHVDSDKKMAQVIFITFFNIYVYLIGKKYDILAFDPDFTTQTCYHALIHILSAHLSYILL